MEGNKKQRHVRSKQDYCESDEAVCPSSVPEFPPQPTGWYSLPGCISVSSLLIRLHHFEASHRVCLPHPGAPPALSALDSPTALLQPLHSGPQPLCYVTCWVPLHSSALVPRPCPAAPALRGRTFCSLTCHHTSRHSVTPSAVVKLTSKWAMQSTQWHLSKLTISLGM